MFPSPYEDGQVLKELFEHPDTWRQTRRNIDGIGYADHWLNSQFTDAQLRAWLPQLSKWGLKLGLEVGAVKPGRITAEKAFAVSRPKWDRFIADGARIDNIAMDEPLAATVINLHLPMEYGAEQTALYIAKVRHAYPGMAIGDIEPYPYFNAEEIMGFIDNVQARLRQMGVKGLDFLRLDVDWMHFRPGDPKGQLGWRGVKEIEAQCHQRGMRFSLIYWAANYPSLQRAGQATPHTWTSSILYQSQAYAEAGGAPDEYFIESWLLSQNDPVPPHAVPETSPDTLTGSVLTFKAGNAFHQ
jgi:hypothetical protein